MEDTFEVVDAEGLDSVEETDLVDGAEDVTDLVTEEDLQFIDIDQFRDHRVTVKVDGEEVTIPLAEAVAGYQRQADYTRKTQELAKQKADMQWAAAIKGALENDPAGTLELLAGHFGVKATPSPARPADPFEIPDWNEPDVDPRYRQIEERLSRFEEERAQQQLERTISHLSDKYGEEFDAQEVVSAAIASGSTDLEATFKQIKFDKIMEEARRAKAAAAKVTQKQAAKRDAQVVSGGSPAGAGKSSDAAVYSIADAWREAKRSLGA